MGSKFILKKDLPIGKAGTIIDNFRSSHGTEELSFIQVGKCKCQIPDNIKFFDWVEEIKPFTAYGIYIESDYKGLLSETSPNIDKIKDYIKLNGFENAKIVKIEEVEI